MYKSRRRALYGVGVCVCMCACVCRIDCVQVACIKLGYCMHAVPIVKTALLVWPLPLPCLLGFFFWGLGLGNLALLASGLHRSWEVRRWVTWFIHVWCETKFFFYVCVGRVLGYLRLRIEGLSNVLVCMCVLWNEYLVCWWYRGVVMHG